MDMPIFSFISMLEMRIIVVFLVTILAMGYLYGKAFKYVLGVNPSPSIVLILILLSFCVIFSVRSTRLLFGRISAGAHRVTERDVFNASETRELVRGIRTGDFDKVKRCVSEGYDINVKGRFNLTPLYFALYYQQPEIFQYLLDNGADPNIEIESSRTENTRYRLLPSFITAVVTDNDSRFLIALLNKGVNPNLPPNSNRSIKYCFFRREFESTSRSQNLGDPLPTYQQRKKSDIEKLNALLEHGLEMEFCRDYGSVQLKYSILSSFSLSPEHCRIYFIPVLFNHNAVMDGNFFQGYLETLPHRSAYCPEAQKDFAIVDLRLNSLDPNWEKTLSELLAEKDRISRSIPRDFGEQNYDRVMEPINAKIQKYTDELNQKLVRSNET